jgi:6-phosphofructokinase 2
MGGGNKWHAEPPDLGYLCGLLKLHSFMTIATLTLNPALDKSTATPKLQPEQKLRCAPMQMDAGGGGINVSKGIAKLGGQSTAFFPAGGYNGQVIQQLLQDAGVLTSVIKTSGETRENLSVTETSTNNQYRFTLPGQELLEATADACLALIGTARPSYLVASGSLPPGLPVTYFEKVAAFAKNIGARFILDTSGEALAAAADEGLYLLKPNLTELSALVGVEKLEMDAVDDAALEIIHQGKCEVVVVSLGPQGAMLVTKEEVKHIPAPPVQKRSTVGAGDSMVAGMVWGLSQGKTAREMAQLGVACGSAATLNQGTELFVKEDALRLLDWIQRYGARFRLKDI